LLECVGVKIKCANFFSRLYITLVWSMSMNVGSWRRGEYICTICGKDLSWKANERRRVQDNPRQYVCEKCYQDTWKPQEIQRLRDIEAEKPEDKQRKCSVCKEFLTDVDDRSTDSTGARFHDRCLKPNLNTKNPYLITLNG